jgi:hypothetical protein
MTHHCLTQDAGHELAVTISQQQNRRGVVWKGRPLDEGIKAREIALYMFRKHSSPVFTNTMQEFVVGGVDRVLQLTYNLPRFRHVTLVLKPILREKKKEKQLPAAVSRVGLVVSDAGGTFWCRT